MNSQVQIAFSKRLLPKNKHWHDIHQPRKVGFQKQYVSEDCKTELLFTTSTKTLHSQHIKLLFVNNWHPTSQQQFKFQLPCFQHSSLFMCLGRLKTLCRCHWCRQSRLLASAWTNHGHWHHLMREQWDTGDISLCVCKINTFIIIFNVAYTDKKDACPHRSSTRKQKVKEQKKMRGTNASIFFPCWCIRDRKRSGPLSAAKAHQHPEIATQCHPKDPDVGKNAVWVALSLNSS